MTGSERKPNTIVTNLILLLLVLVLIYALYRVTDGNLSALLRPETYSGGGDPLSQMVGSLRNLGNGLRDMFSGMLR